MEIAIALLFSVSIGCAVYVVIAKKRQRNPHQRIKKNMNDAPFPYIMSKTSKRKTEMVLKNPNWDTKSKKMFRPAFVGKKAIRFTA